MQTIIQDIDSLDLRTEEEKIGAYISFLRNHGYVVIEKNFLSTSTITTVSGLVDFFYAYLQYKNEQRLVHYTKASKKDNKIASNFIKSRMTSGIGRKEAIKECVAIIRCLIDHEHLFGLSFPIGSMGILGQDSMKWVSDKAISIINEEDADADCEYLKSLEDFISQSQEQELQDSIDDRIYELRTILRGLEDEKERRKQR